MFVRRKSCVRIFKIELHFNFETSCFYYCIEPHLYIAHYGQTDSLIHKWSKIFKLLFLSFHLKCVKFQLSSRWLHFFPKLKNPNQIPIFISIKFDLKLDIYFKLVSPWITRWVNLPSALGLPGLKELHVVQTRRVLILKATSSLCKKDMCTE